MDGQTEAVIRRSPIVMPAEAAKSRRLGEWPVVWRYRDEGTGPWLVDLSHVAKWDVQDRGLDDLRPGDLSIPSGFGECVLREGVLVQRLNATQARLWDLSGTGFSLADPGRATDVTDGFCLLALLGGPAAVSVMERVSTLDISPGGRSFPYLLQGPVTNVASQVVVFGPAEPSAFLIAFARGYAQALVDFLLAAGAPLRLRPAGLKRFHQYLQRG